MFLERLVRLLLPRQDRFFELLEGIGRQMESAASAFGELGGAVRHEEIRAIAARLKPIETEADNLCHRLYEELDRVFVTPIDREDLAALTKALDDVIDSMEHAAAFAALYQFDALSEPMKQLVRLSVRASGELVRAVNSLRQYNDPESIREPTVAVHTIENEADAVYRGAIAALFTNGTDPRELVRQKDMLYCLEDSVDECEDAMDVIRSVVVKNG
jgi:predicted phosphate transport protein (TIGR00153 family)